MIAVPDRIVHVHVPARKLSVLDRLTKHLGEVLRLQVDRDAGEMRAAMTAALTEVLSHRALARLELFGRGEGEPILLVDGLPCLAATPPSPAHGFGDDSRVAGIDAVLLGVLCLTGLSPIAYQHENSGRMFRDVLANPGSKGEVSSHGSDRPFGAHTDNPAGPFEVESWRGSPIPRALAFHSLRNHDASGLPVPTDILPVSSVLATVSPKTRRTLRQPVFRINPPVSNHLAPVEQVPLLVGDRTNGGPFFRYDGNKDGEVPRVEGLTPSARESLRELQEKIDAATDSVISLDLQAGSVLVIDNYRVLHARRAYDPGTDWRKSRWLRRCYGCQNPDRGTYVDRIHSPFVWR